MIARVALFLLLWPAPVFCQNQIWDERIPRITREQFDATLAYWEAQHPDILTIETFGKTPGGEDLKMLILTDPSVDDDEKQRAFITALHGGPERTGTTTCMHALEWLLSDDEFAKETLRRQLLIVIPIFNPKAFFETDRFLNENKIDPYTGGTPDNWDFKKMTYLAGDKAPEVKAFLDLVDRYQPEFHIDLHGIGLQDIHVEQLGDHTRYIGQTMFEVTGSAYSNYALRPWDWRVTEHMIKAAMDAGYPSDRFEADAQRAYWGPAMNGIVAKTWRGRPNFYTAQYAYAKYHTMLACLEIGWEESGLIRLKAALELGNNAWETEKKRGYPVDRVQAFAGHFVTPWGRNAAERRRSRIELWNRQPEFTQAILYPQTDMRDSYIVSMGSDTSRILQGDLLAFAKSFGEENAVTEFVQIGPELKLAVNPAAAHNPESKPVE
ncbi:MAG: M14 family zinc carboxypeptidase, partial [Verrucomicrobiota bacterium]